MMLIFIIITSFMLFVNTTYLPYNKIKHYIQRQGGNFVQNNNLYLYPNIINARKNKYTQCELAELMGISQQEISRYEKGTVKAPINYIIDVADICGVSVDYILGRENRKTDNEDPDKEELMKMYDKLTEKNKIRAAERIRTLLSIQEEN